jgi:hypothetical protein
LGYWPWTLRRRTWARHCGLYDCDGGFHHSELPGLCDTHANRRNSRLQIARELKTDEPAETVRRQTLWRY